MSFTVLFLIFSLIMLMGIFSMILIKWYDICHMTWNHHLWTFSKTKCPKIGKFTKKITKTIKFIKKWQNYHYQKLIKIKDFILIEIHQPYSQVVDEDIRCPDVHGGHPDLLHAPVLGTVPPQVLVHPTL